MKNKRAFSYSYYCVLYSPADGMILFTYVNTMHRRPKKGSALLFFPAAGGIPGSPFDIRTLHCGEAVTEDAESEKWIAQLWLRQGDYKPTAPTGNEHANAYDAIGKYCMLAK